MASSESTRFNPTLMAVGGALRRLKIHLSGQHPFFIPFKTALPGLSILKSATSFTRAFIDATIEGVIIRSMAIHQDSRGWLVELFRNDQPEDGPDPAMAYASITLPGISRGPHEHRRQTDRFCFFGPSDFRLVLWDNRSDSATFNHRMRLVVGQSAPTLVTVPHGVVHGYRNIGSESGLIVNLPDQLYHGKLRTGQVDEIRHELDPDSPFDLED